MNSNGLIERHWFRVTAHLVCDVILFTVLFCIATNIRLGGNWSEAWSQYLSAVLPGAVCFGCGAYICGLYSGRTPRRAGMRQAFLLLVCFAGAVCVMMALFYLNYSSRVGRGVMLIGSVLSYGAILLHHLFLSPVKWMSRPKVALLVGSELEEMEARMLCSIWPEQLELVGVISGRDGYVPGDGVRLLGSVGHVKEIAAREGLDRVLCSHDAFSNRAFFGHFWELRYSGVTVMPTVSLCEEVLQCVPLELVTPDWLVMASASPEMSYIKKIKRGFDVVCAAVGLALAAPLLLAGMLWVRLVSRGPVFYRQTRVGKFGRQFSVLKLRTMRVDAEAHGAVWAQDKDPRVFLGGGILRKYRFDEIPQLWNVLRGEMSLVGPRPERPEFVSLLSEEIPYYPERLMIQPGLTGWAQVNYPYGKTVEDAKRKLEYDLYYMKHMGIFLDLFVLLDTVRIIVTGGVGSAGVAPHPLRVKADDRQPSVSGGLLAESQAASGSI